MICALARSQTVASLKDLVGISGQVRPGDGTLYVRNLEAIVDKHEAYLEIRLKIEAASSQRGVLRSW